MAERGLPHELRGGDGGHDAHRFPRDNSGREAEARERVAGAGRVTVVGRDDTVCGDEPDCEYQLVRPKGGSRADLWDRLTCMIMTIVSFRGGSWIPAGSCVRLAGALPF